MSIEDRLQALEAAVFGKSGAKKSAKGFSVNIDDPKWGDPEIRYVPKKWDGPSPLGQRMSQCSVRFLRFLAGELESSARWKDSNGKEEHAEWDRRDAAKATAWAERKEAQGEPSLDEGDDLF